MLNSLSHCVIENKPCIGWVNRYFKDCLCNFRDELSFGFGLISVVLWGVAEIPQIITNFRTKSGHGVSIFFLITWVVGDILNLAGCLLEPATLPTQSYTAVLYATGTAILVIQSLYYDYFIHRWRNGPEKELNQEVEDVKIPLRPSKRPYPTIPIPTRDHEATPSEEICYYISARSLGTTPPIPSYLGPTVGIRNYPSYHDEANNPIPPKNYFSKSIPIPKPAGLAAFLATLIDKPHGTNALMQVYVGLAGRKLLQENGTGSVYGQWLGWMMAVIYMGGRLPQIWLNIKRGNVKGLNPLMFIFALNANAAYVASILVRSTAWDKIKANMPWLLDAVGCITLDLFIILQYLYYRYCKKQRSIQILH